jgi:hypothetical protein
MPCQMLAWRQHATLGLHPHPSAAAHCEAAARCGGAQRQYAPPPVTCVVPPDVLPQVVFQVSRPRMFCLVSACSSRGGVQAFGQQCRMGDRRRQLAGGGPCKARAAGACCISISVAHR